MRLITTKFVVFAIFAIFASANSALCAADLSIYAASNGTSATEASESEFPYVMRPVDPANFSFLGLPNNPVTFAVSGSPIAGGTLKLSTSVTQVNPDETAYFFYSVGAVEGSTTVTVNGHSITLPIADATPCGSTPLSSGFASGSVTVPSKIGSDLNTIVVIANANTFRVSLVVPSGPILGEDIGG